MNSFRAERAVSPLDGSELWVVLDSAFVMHREASDFLRALHGAGYTRLEDLTKVTESEVMRLHGMGANAMQVLRNALRERGLSFRDG